MELRLQPTSEFFMAGDVMVRAWQGTTGDGHPVIALIAAIGFTAEIPVAAGALVSIPPPTPEDAMKWAERIFVGQTDREAGS